MAIVAKISRGSKMDQIYIPKNRAGFSTGQYVLISPLESELKQKRLFKPCYYGIKTLENLKLKIIQEIFEDLEDQGYENIIITGSFLETGFKFNDIDVILINGKKIETSNIKEKIEKKTGIKAHVIIMDSKTLMAGLSKDPLYSMMLSKCVSKKRLIFNVKRDIDYKILDYQLLKSNTLIDNFDLLNGEEKYYLTLNMISILLFIKNQKLSRKVVNNEIERIFKVEIKEIKENLLDKSQYTKKYVEIYNTTFNLIMEGINEQK